MGTEIKGLQNHIDPGVSSLHSHRVQQQFLQAVRPGDPRRLKWEELRNTRKKQLTGKKNSEGDLIQAFGVTEDQMEKAAAMLGRNKKLDQKIGKFVSLTTKGLWN